MQARIAPRKKPALTPAHKRVLAATRAIAALALALVVWLGLGMSQARAAAQTFVVPTMTITGPNVQGVIGGPPGVITTVKANGWLAYSSVTLSVSENKFRCDGPSLATVPTDPAGAFSAHFFWPTTENNLTQYYVCGVQANKGTVFSRNTFTVLASSPASVSFSPAALTAGDTLTVSGSNWVPGPQTVKLLIQPCSSPPCTKPSVATGQVVTANNGSFSLQMTVAASAASGNYYVQAVNLQATISSVSAAPVQVTAQGDISGTPIPGVSPTSVATRTTQGKGSGTASGAPPGNTGTALKDAVLAAGGGLLVLIFLIGMIAFFMNRSRGRDLPELRKAAARAAGARGTDGTASPGATPAKWRQPKEPVVTAVDAQVQPERAPQRVSRRGRAALKAAQERAALQGRSSQTSLGQPGAVYKQGAPPAPWVLPPAQPITPPTPMTRPGALAPDSIGLPPSPPPLPTPEARPFDPKEGPRRTFQAGDLIPPTPEDRPEDEE